MMSRSRLLVPQHDTSRASLFRVETIFLPLAFRGFRTCVTSHCHHGDRVTRMVPVYGKFCEEEREDVGSVSDCPILLNRSVSSGLFKEIRASWENVSFSTIQTRGHGLTTASRNLTQRLSSGLVSQNWRKSVRPIGCLSHRLL